MARKRKRQIKLSVSRVSLVIVILGLLGLGMLYVSLRMGQVLPEAVRASLGAIGTISIFVYTVSLIVAFRSMRWHEFSIIWRLLALILAAVNLVAWIGLYFVGIAAVL